MIKRVLWLAYIRANIKYVHQNLNYAVNMYCDTLTTLYLSALIL